MKKIVSSLPIDLTKVAKSVLTTVLLIILPMVLQAQSKADILGNWAVQKVELSEEVSLNEEQEKQMELLFFELKKSTFYFYQNQKATLYLTMADTIKTDCIWMYDDSTKIITLADVKNKQAVRAKIFVELSKDKEVKFHIVETPFILIVGK